MVYIGIVSDGEQHSVFVSNHSVDSEDFESNHFLVPVEKGFAPEGTMNFVRNILAAAGSLITVE